MPPPLAVVRTIADLRALIRGWRAQGDTVALVPTIPQEVARSISRRKSPAVVFQSARHPAGHAL